MRSIYLVVCWLQAQLGWVLQPIWESLATSTLGVETPVGGETGFMQ